MIKVYFETTRTSYATIVAIFDNEDSYAACLPALEKLAERDGFDLITESVDNSMTLDQADDLIENKIANTVTSATTETYARFCDATGEGMNEGYCFGDGERYFKYETDASKYAQLIGYDTLQSAYEDGAYYYTAWEE